jgi:hypothetical protein
MKIAYWRLYLSVQMSAENAFVVISNAEAKRLRKHFDTDGKRSMLSVSAGNDAGETPRAFYINIDQVAALEPIAG